jgi:MtaA/CmuA family methyltransferase
MQEMSGRERTLALLKGEEPDSIPLMPITMMAAADFIKEPYGRYALDYRIQARGQLEISAHYDIDHVSVVSDPATEAHDYGASIVFYDDQPPAVDEANALFLDKTRLANFSPPSPWDGKRMSNRIRAVEEMKNQAAGLKLIEGWIEGPCAESSDLRGINNLMMDFFDDPLFVTDLFEIVVESGISFAREQIKVGADIIGVGDAAASLVGPGFYNEMVWKYEKRIVDAIHEMGAMVRLHICGNVTDILEGMGRLGCDLVDVDSLAAFDKARADTGPAQLLCGNIDPVRVLRNGTAEQVRREVETCFNQANPGFICGAGCEVPRDTPEENLRVLTNFARGHGL